MLTRLNNSKLYDPAQNLDGAVRDIYFRHGVIIDPPGQDVVIGPGRTGPRAHAGHGHEGCELFCQPGTLRVPIIDADINQNPGCISNQVLEAVRYAQRGVSYQAH